MIKDPSKIKKLYYSIGEVSKITELKQYVLRYWETEFKELSPSKNKAGNRTYRQKDIDLINKIKDLYRYQFLLKCKKHDWQKFYHWTSKNIGMSIFENTNKGLWKLILSFCK